MAASFNTPTLFVLAEDLSIMQLRVEIDEADVGQVASNQSATFTVDAYPGRQFPAQVERVDLASGNIALTNEQQQQGNQVVSYEARLTVSNGEGLLRPGMTATATIAIDSTEVSLIVPNGALRFDPGDQGEEEPGVFGPRSFGLDREREAGIGIGSQQSVYTRGEDGELQEITVITGASDGRWTAVTSEELTEGMEVIIGIKAGTD